MRVHRNLSFAIPWSDARLDWLLSEFRQMVNESIRAALANNIGSRGKLSALCYAELSSRHRIHKKYISSAFEVALGMLKGHRRRARKGLHQVPPFLRRPMLKGDNQSYQFDRDTGRLRVPIAGTEGVQFDLPLSRWHRAVISDGSWRMGSFTLVPGKVSITFSRETGSPLAPEAAIALDTNESSLDGVLVDSSRAQLVSVVFPDIRQLQATYFRRRRRLSKKKVHDRRLKRRLLGAEYGRERARVRQRLHLMSRRIVQTAVARKAAIVLEALTLPAPRFRSRRLTRRFSSWPRGQLHRQIEYKAALAGVPVIKVNPAWTSKTCPVCGARRRDRVGQDFVCLACDWEMDRQHNAGLNILKTALASNEALARAVRFRPGALRDDVVSPLYDPCRGGGSAREEPSGAESGALLAS